jgi:chemotaxis response regulator CheB
VLLVDDAAAIRNALRGVLEDAGIEIVREARTGPRAWPWPARSLPTWC